MARSTCPAFNTTQIIRRRILYIIVLLATILISLTASVSGQIDRIDRERSTLPAGLVRTLWAAIVLFCGSFGFLSYDLIKRRVVHRKLALVGFALTIIGLISTIFSGMSSDSITHARREKNTCSYFDENGDAISGSTSGKCSGCKSSQGLSRTCCCCLSHKRCNGPTDSEGHCLGKYVTRYEKTAYVGVDSCDTVLSDSNLYGSLISSTVFYSFVFVLFGLWSCGTLKPAPEMSGPPVQISCACPSWCHRPTSSSPPEQPSTRPSQTDVEMSTRRAASARSAAAASPPPASVTNSKSAEKQNYPTSHAASSNASDLPSGPPPDYYTVVNPNAQ